MTRYVALLRNIGPATHGKMPLGALAESCATAGPAEAVSVGNTGNLVFASDRPQGDVEAIVGRAVAGFGVSNEVFTRTERQLHKLLEAAPFPEAAAERPARLGVCFFHKDQSWPAEYLHYEGPERMMPLQSPDRRLWQPDLGESPHRRKDRRRPHDAAQLDQRSTHRLGARDAGGPRQRLSALSSAMVASSTCGSVR